MGLAVLVAFVGFVIFAVQRYKRCPSNRVLVIFGKVQKGRSATCLHGGGRFVWPIIQDFAFLSLSLEVHADVFDGKRISQRYFDLERDHVSRVLRPRMATQVSGFAHDSTLIRKSHDT